MRILSGAEHIVHETGVKAYDGVLNLGASVVCRLVRLMTDDYGGDSGEEIGPGVTILHPIETEKDDVTGLAELAQKLEAAEQRERLR